MAITSHIQEIGASDHKLAMRDLKPLSGLGREERDGFLAGLGSDHAAPSR